MQWFYKLFAFAALGVLFFSAFGVPVGLRLEEKII
jgi:hypothetical protein